MGPIKRVLLGGAAGIFAVAGAQAADLPVKAKPVEFVKVCSLYGAGFWYVPGTDTCIKIGAFDQVQVGWNVGGGGTVVGYGGGSTGAPAGGTEDRANTSNLGWRNRVAVSVDLRTQTEYGTLRSYVDLGSDVTGASGNNVNPGTTNTFWASRAFIQFAGFTFGRYRSFFDFFNHANYDYFQGNWTGDTSPNGIFGLAYTYQFGGGLSSTLSFEDGGNGFGSRARLVVDATGTVFGANGALTTDPAGQKILDPVLNVRLDQSWGFVGVAGAIHDASGGYYSNGLPVGVANTTLAGHPSDKYGWAVTGSFVLADVFGLKGDTLGAQAVFSRGAASYATSGYGPKTIYGSGNSVGFGFITDGVFGPAGSSIELTDVWSVAAAYEHFWDPRWKTSVYGGFVGVDYSDTAAAYLSGQLGGAGADPNFSYSILGTRTQWNPVPDFSVGLDLSWWRLNTMSNGAVVTLPGAGARPAGSYKLEDQDTFAAMFRVQRNFLY